MQWHSGLSVGHCDAVNISPGGAAFRVGAEDGSRIGPKVALHMDLTPEVQWLVAGDARVIRRVPLRQGMYEIGVAFSGRRVPRE